MLELLKTFADLRLWPRCALLPALLLQACSEAPAPGWSGYAEGDYVYVAAPMGGRLDILAVQAGDQVRQGAVLFTLESEAERAARDEAAARLAGARAQAANLDKGRRHDELAMTESQLTQAQSHAALLRADLVRQQQLVEQGFVAKARVEDAQTALKEAQAKVAELQAALRVARLPARADERAASQANTQAASQALRQTEWRSAQKQQAAPVDALVAELFFRQGEFVPAGQPVLALLPPGQVKARFFVPEAEVAKLAPGQAVQLHCDGCPASVPAQISRIASQAEYTPPVIYSNAQRAKLVFMVEARAALGQVLPLRPGQPLDVRLAGAVGKPGTQP